VKPRLQDGDLLRRNTCRASDAAASSVLCYHRATSNGGTPWGTMGQHGTEKWQFENGEQNIRMIKIGRADVGVFAHI